MPNDDGKSEGTDWQLPATDEGEAEFERELDAALAEYATVEPRVGLEDRILANLQAERKRHVRPAWWRWTAVAAAVVVIVAVLLQWRAGKSAYDTTAHHPNSGAPSGVAPERQPPNAPLQPNRAEVGAHEQRPVPVRATRQHSSQVPALMAAEPRLEQFPSPQPLSEQEKILASYSTKYPEQAALTAQARTEALRRDEVEMGELAGGAQ